MGPHICNSGYPHDKLVLVLGSLELDEIGRRLSGERGSPGSGAGDLRGDVTPIGPGRAVPASSGMGRESVYFGVDIETEALRDQAIE